MKLSEQEIVHKLLNLDDEFQTLHEEHQNMKKQLTELDRKHYHTTTEQLEIKRIKKLKLLSKDKMHAKINDFKRNKVVET